MQRKKVLILGIGLLVLMGCRTSHVTVMSPNSAGVTKTAVATLKDSSSNGSGRLFLIRRSRPLGEDKISVVYLRGDGTFSSYDTDKDSYHYDRENNEVHIRGSSELSRRYGIRGSYRVGRHRGWRHYDGRWVPPDKSIHTYDPEAPEMDW